MVFYIRLLKQPEIAMTKAKVAKAVVKALITITTDLGDEFFPDEIALTAVLILAPATERDSGESTNQCITWKNGMRVLPLEFSLNRLDVTRAIQLHISCNIASDGDLLCPARMPTIVSVWSEVHNGVNTKTEAKMVERRFSLGKDFSLSIWEEMGESIARHVWDAGLALVAHMQSILKESPKEMSRLGHILHLERSKQVKVLELGSGCGIVGIGLAQLMSKCNVLLTDLPEAMDIIGFNISRAQPAESSWLAGAIFDWNQASSNAISGQQFDLILVSDCTYNPDSLPALVRTLSGLMSQSGDTSIVVSMKVRHSSEAVFFDLMSEARFIVVEHSNITLPDNHRGRTGRTLESVDIYTFRKG